jgi:hypothetical protein
MDEKTWFDCGWNDTVYGLLTCRSGEQMVKYIHDMQVAAKKTPSQYSNGAISVIDTAFNTGKIPQRKG